MAAQNGLTATLDQSEKAKTWRRFLANSTPTQSRIEPEVKSSDLSKRPAKWTLGILNDKETDEVPGDANGAGPPGSILLMSKESHYNEPLGLRNAPARTSASSLPSVYPPEREPASERTSLSSTRRVASKKSIIEAKKKTADGAIILEPQPEDSMNDPLNWPSWRRDIALLSLGFYCMLGGGMTPVLAAGYSNVAKSYKIEQTKVALTTGLYMMGLGFGSVLTSPTAILYGKRPVYLFTSLLFILSSIWCALSPSYSSLVIARIFMGFAVSPVECLPSATIAEIFFLHERAYRLGVYTLLLLGGKNLVPLVSAAIIQRLEWQWVFWVVALVAGFCSFLLFFFVPETFWDRTPRAKDHSKDRKGTFASISTMFNHQKKPIGRSDDHSHILATASLAITPNVDTAAATIAQKRLQKHRQHVGFADNVAAPEGVVTLTLSDEKSDKHTTAAQPPSVVPVSLSVPLAQDHLSDQDTSVIGGQLPVSPVAFHSESWRVEPRGEGPQTPHLRNLNSPSYETKENPLDQFMKNDHDPEALSQKPVLASSSLHANLEAQRTRPTMGERVPSSATDRSLDRRAFASSAYTHQLRSQPPKSFFQSLRPWNGRLRQDKWLKVAVRPFILFAYPAILWSALVYSLSIGWLIVLSEAVSVIYRNPDTYNFSALSTGLIYISPFIGGILGTAVAGKLSDRIVQYMARKNEGIYEPEYRLVMAVPVVVTTCIGLMGFGWSAAERDLWIVPTLFFGVISFGCALGSTTSITFAVDSYRQYAGEALVTMNFSKNIFHGLLFSLFFPDWLVAKGSKNVFVAIGCIQLVCLTATIPMYIYGKRARMWTVRRNMMERF